MQLKRRLNNAMRRIFVPIMLRLSIIFFAVMLGTSVAAQENKTVDGTDLGPSEWRAIALGDSEFQESPDTGDFLIQRNELFDRVQESWRHPDNAQHGPLVTMFYERLVDNFFAAEMFEADFRRVFNSAFAARGVDLDDARVVDLDDRAKAAFISYAATRCIFIMRVFGPVVGSPRISNGDRNARLFVCQRGDPEDVLLRDTALSMLSILRQEGRDIGIPDNMAPPLPELLERLFTAEEAA
jgi:hypothetical protein